MFAPASLDDAAARFLETTALTTRFRWDPHRRSWAVRADEGWTHITTEMAVTTVARFLADEFEAREAFREPIPIVLSGVRAAPTWATLRAKLSRSLVNAVTRYASGSAAFCGLDETPEPTTAARPSTDAASGPPAVAVWLRSAITSAPEAFLRRSSVTSAFASAHGNGVGTPSRQVVSRVAAGLFGDPVKRDGIYGWPGLILTEEA